jgi:hypothetical protein
MHQKILFITTVLLFITTSTFAYMVTNTQKYDGYSESKLSCTDGRETFVYKTPQGYYLSQYKRYKTFKAAANSSCAEKKHSKYLKTRIRYLKHNARICKTINSIRRVLRSEVAYYHSRSRACFLAMNLDTINLLSYFENATLIDRYYKVEYQDKIHYVREEDVKFKKKENVSVPHTAPLSKVEKHTNKSQENIKKHKKIVNKKVKSKNIDKEKKLLKKKENISVPHTAPISKVEKHTNKSQENIKKHKKIVNKKVKSKNIDKEKKLQKKATVYYCRAISRSARGWSTASSLSKAQKNALHQCTILTKTPKPCWIEKCYQK